MKSEHDTTLSDKINTFLNLIWPYYDKLLITLDHFEHALDKYCYAHTNSSDNQTRNTSSLMDAQTADESLTN